MAKYNTPEFMARLHEWAASVGAEVVAPPKHYRMREAEYQGAYYSGGNYHNPSDVSGKVPAYLMDRHPSTARLTLQAQRCPNSAWVMSKQTLSSLVKTRGNGIMTWWFYATQEIPGTDSVIVYLGNFGLGGKRLGEGLNPWDP